MHEGDHAPSPSSQVKNAWSYTSIPPYNSMHMDAITFIFIKSLFLTYAESYQVPHLCCLSHYSTDFINFSINEPKLASNTTT